MYINQYQLQKLERSVEPNKVVIIFGGRRTGKTTMIEKYLENKKDYLLVSGEDYNVQEYLSSGSINKLKDFVGNIQLLVIDEAQKIENIGVNLKLCIDHIKNLKIIATGSSAFDLAKHFGEPLN